MIYGVEQTTDSRYPETVVRKFTKRAAKPRPSGRGGIGAY